MNFRLKFGMDVNKSKYSLFLNIVQILIFVIIAFLIGCGEDDEIELPVKPTLLEPLNNSSTTNLSLYFEWSSVNGASNYRLQIDNNSEFSSPEIDIEINEESYSLANDISLGKYFWRVTATNSENLIGKPSEVFTFTLVSAWAPKEPMPTARDGLAIGVVKGKIYAIGGHDEFYGFVGINEEYDPITNSWTAKAFMPYPKVDFAIGVVGDKIYVLGGYSDNWEPQNLTQRYDPQLNIWVRKKNMPTERNGLAVGVVNNKIYAIGGFHNGLDTNEEYDPSMDSWSTKTPMPTKRGFLAIGAVGNKIFALGGENDAGWSDLNEVYDPQNDTWSTVAPMKRGNSINSWPVEDSYFSVAVVQDKIYVIGGYRIGNTNIEYDMTTDMWIKKQSPSIGRFRHACGVINSKIYVIGGRDRDGNIYASNVEYNPVIDE
jgi:Kelch motif